jgi:LmbE family N-acetylglucosaminyl deacetylase
MKSVLAIAAHPDDEVLGCGGTLARLANSGIEVNVAILGEGVTSRFTSREGAAADSLEELRRHAREASGLMGVKGVHFCGLPDNRFDTLPLLEVVKVVEDLVSRLSPDAIYTHHGGDLNVDHQVVNRAVLTATRPKPGATVKEILAFEVPSSTEWAFQHLSPVFRPNVFVDVTGTLAVKIRAMSCYQTEICEFPHPRSGPALEAIGKRWGSVVGCGAAEAFELIRSIR